MVSAIKSIHSFQTYYSSQKLKIGITLFLAVACPLFLLMPAYATTLTVSNNADSGAGSLRQAIASANSGDTIDFASKLVIDKALTIASTVPVTVSGNSSSRVISTSLPLTLTGFTIADGSTPDDGAGVFAGDSLVVDRMTFTGNINSNSQSANGGAIYAVGKLQVDHSSFLRNEAQV